MPGGKTTRQAGGCRVDTRPLKAGNGAENKATKCSTQFFMNKQIFLLRLQRERDHFERLLNQAGFSRQLTLRGVLENLSIKDLLAETLSREQFLADRLGEIVEGESYTPCSSYAAYEKFQACHGYPDYESPFFENGAIHPLVIEKYKNVSLDDIVAQELEAYASIIESLRTLRDEQCLGHNVFQRVAEGTYKTYRRMTQDILRWQQSIEKGIG